MQKLSYYQELNKKVGSFPVTYLQHKLKGILRGDLILIGARSGAGKTTIANMIALHNARNGVKVALFSLENFEGDMFVEKAFYYYRRFTGNYNLSLRDFASASFQADMLQLDKAEKQARKDIENINLIERSKDYGVTELKDEIINQAENQGAEMIIIDHLDYVDKFKGVSDVEHITDLMKTIRKVQDAYKIPVVAISHLRKSGNKDMPAVPSMDEFIGSSNKVKESTAVILLAPDDNGNVKSNDLEQKLTWCCIRKLRMGGIDNKVAKITFNKKTGEYDKGYGEYKVNYSGTEVKEI